MALASLTADPGAGPLEPVVEAVDVRPGPDGGTVEVRVDWAEDGTGTRIVLGTGSVVVDHA